LLLANVASPEGESDFAEHPASTTFGRERASIGMGPTARWGFSIFQPGARSSTCQCPGRRTGKEASARIHPSWMDSDSPTVFVRMPIGTGSALTKHIGNRDSAYPGGRGLAPGAQSPCDTEVCSAQLPPDNVAFASRQATRGYRKDCRRRGRLRSGLSPCAASICGCQARVGAEQLKLQQQPFEHRLRNSAAGTSTGFETWRTDQQIFWEYSASATTRCSAAKVTTLPSSHASVWLGSTWSSSSTASKCRCVAHCFSRLTTGRCLTVLGTSSSFSMLT